MSTDSRAAQIASYYIRRYGFAIVPIEPGQKGPRGKGWNLEGGYLTDHAQAVRFYNEHPNWNMGAVLGPSQLCSLDVDNVEYATIVLSEFNIDIHELRAGCPTVVGNPARFRVLFRAPADTELERKALTWPNPKDPDGSRKASLIRAAVAAEQVSDYEEGARLRAEAKPLSRITVLELRGGAVQDVLPPSIHPETNRAYSWRTALTGEIPVLDNRILELWQDWDDFRSRAESLCAWHVKPSGKPQASSVTRDGMSVIEAYNAAHDIAETLLRYGYQHQHGGRYLSPHSSTGQPGVFIQEGKNRAWNEHGSDPLCSSNSGHPVSPFDLFCEYEHGGDVRAATKAAAQQLGVVNRAVARRPEPPVVDPETGEIITSAPAPISRVPRAVLVEQYALETNDKGVPHPTVANVVRVLQGDPTLARTIWLDEFLDRICTIWRSDIVREWSDVDDINLQVYLQETLGLPKLGKQSVVDAVIAVANMDRRNEALAYLQGLEWDGTQRLSQFFQDCFGADDSEYTRCVGMNFWTSLVARIARPGCKVDTMIVLEGPQGAGKSKALSIIGGNWFAEAHESPTTKDFYLNLAGKLVVEIGEMDSFSRAEVTKVKQVITCQTDRYRAPYERRSADHPRRCVFAGTTNRDDWNRDETGARRFWPIFCTDIRHDIIEFNRDQLFAEAYQRLLSGADWWTMPLEATRDQQEARRDADELESVLFDWLLGRTSCTVGEVMNEVLKLPIDRQEKAVQMRIGRVLRALGWVRPKAPVHRGGKQLRVWLRPGHRYDSDKFMAVKV